jgi:hypothetical protein
MISQKHNWDNSVFLKKNENMFEHLSNLDLLNSLILCGNYYDLKYLVNTHTYEDVVIGKFLSDKQIQLLTNDSNFKTKINTINLNGNNIF